MKIFSVNGCLGTTSARVDGKGVSANLAPHATQVRGPGGQNATDEILPE
jgi:hypothetical protein